MSSKNPPNRYRCLLGLLASIVCLVMAALLIAVDNAACGSSRSEIVECAEVPAALVLLCLAGSFYGLIYTMYRAYRDFCLGAYVWDLKRSGNI